jgi:protein-tyrosine-phosphatase
VHAAPAISPEPRDASATPTGAGQALRKLRRLARSLRHAPERALHRVRRRAALRRLAAGGEPESVLFLCQGNICRSPYAAAAFARALPEAARARVRVTSAGFIGPDRPAPPEALSTAALRGLDLGPHRSSLVSRERVDAASLVVVMTPEQARSVRRGFRRPAADVLVLGDLDPHPIETRAVHDPWGHPVDAYVRSYERIERCARILAKAVAGERK